MTLMMRELQFLSLFMRSTFFSFFLVLFCIVSGTVSSSALGVHPICPCVYTAVYAATTILFNVLFGFFVSHPWPFIPTLRAS